MLSSISLFRLITPNTAPTDAQARPLPQDDRLNTEISARNPKSTRDTVEISAKGRSLAQGENELSKEEQEEVRKLKERDQHVRNHEQAHLAAAGPYAKGGPKYEFQNGPDQRQYAVGGEVPIDTSKTGSPDKDLIKARTIKAAASAPADPSGQDQSVAAAANQMEAEALQKLNSENLKRTQNGYGNNGQKSFTNSSALGQALDLSA